MITTIDAAKMMKDFIGSARPNRRTENISVHPVIVPELEFIDVQRQILLADLVECADNAAVGMA